MDGEFGRELLRAEIGHRGNVAQSTTIRSRAECLIQLLGAFQDVADFDDIHQAAERLDAVQAWIRREARTAAAELAFDDDAGTEFRVGQRTA